MKVRELEEYRAPRRSPRPLLLALLGAVVVTTALLWLVTRGRNTDAGDDDRGTDAEIEQPVTTPAVHGTDQSGTPSIDVTQVLKLARERDKVKDMAGAREHYLALVGEPLDAVTRREVETALGRIHTSMVTTPVPMPEKVDYIVKSGDSVARIAKRFGTTIDLVTQSNNIQNPRLIKIGDRYRILQGKFEIEVGRRSNSLVLRMDGKFFKRYPVGTGRFEKTPVGTFVITDKQKEPVWWRPDGKEIAFGDSQNILGTRWMAIRATGDTLPVRGYGVHGTWDDNSIGKSESAGCIRMHNRDVEQLYTLVTVGTPVKIADW